MNRHTNNRDNIDKSVDIDSKSTNNTKSAEDTGVIRAERIALQLAAVDISCRKKLFNKISYKDFSNDSRRIIGKAILDLGDKKVTLGKLLTHLKENEAKEIGQEQMELIVDYDAAMSECIEKINHGIIKRQRSELMNKINDSATPKDEKKRLMMKVQEMDRYQKHSASLKGEE